MTLSFLSYDDQEKKTLCLRTSAFCLSTWHCNAKTAVFCPSTMSKTRQKRPLRCQKHGENRLFVVKDTLKTASSLSTKNANLTSNAQPRRHANILITNFLSPRRHKNHHLWSVTIVTIP